MTIDERLERLTERHEALTHSVEMMPQAIRDNSASIRENSEHINALVRIASIHERRLTDLEGTSGKG